MGLGPPTIWGFGEICLILGTEAGTCGHDEGHKRGVSCGFVIISRGNGGGGRDLYYLAMPALLQG